MKTLPLPLALLVAGLSGLGCTDQVPERSGVILAAPPAAPPPSAAAPIEEPKPAPAPAGNGTANETGQAADPLNAAYSREQPQDPSVHAVPGASPMNGTLMPANAGQLKTP